MSTPRNTTRDMQDPANSLAFLLQASADGSPSNAIEAMEAQGQREMVASTSLPTDTLSYKDADFEALGFTFGEVDAADPLFREATLPEGWSRKGGDHAMWSDIVDQRGVARVNVFYKAAFYDRKAHMAIVNVGRDHATKWIYGDDIELTLRSDLTPTELQDMRAGAEQYLENAERPDIYGDRLPRAQTLLERIAGDQS